MCRLTLGYLSYITDRNHQNRFDDFKSSLASLSHITSKNIEMISVDNNSTVDSRLELSKSDSFVKKYHYDRNHFDIGLFYTTAWHAKENNRDYICLMYDDFIVYDDAFDDVIDFMDKNSNVHYTRIAEYDFDNKKKYDCDLTPKYTNPDAIRHYNTVTNEKLNWSDPIIQGKHRFFINNWHYTSRPSVWRTEFFLKVLEKQGTEESNVLQGFEKWAMSSFNESGIVTGVLDNGMVRTTPVSKSARNMEFSLEYEKSIKTSLADLKKEYEKFLNT